MKANYTLMKIHTSLNLLTYRYRVKYNKLVFVNCYGVEEEKKRIENKTTH